jgi:hypothetical protein
MLLQNYAVYYPDFENKSQNNEDLKKFSICVACKRFGKDRPKEVLEICSTNGFGKLEISQISQMDSGKETKMKRLQVNLSKIKDNSSRALLHTTFWVINALRHHVER